MPSGASMPELDAGQVHYEWNNAIAPRLEIEPGDTVAVWGGGPVGQFAIKSAYMLGAERVIAIDRIAERLKLAEEKGGAETIDYERLEQPAVMRKGRSAPAHGAAPAFDASEIPAFLRKQAD